MKRLWGMGFFLLLSTIGLVFMIAFVILFPNSRFSNEELSFAESEVITDFPIPKGTIAKDHNGESDRFKHSVTYVYENIGGEQGLHPSEQYLQEIENRGWMENKAERMGHKYQFEKGERSVWFIIHEDFFDVLELK